MKPRVRDSSTKSKRWKGGREGKERKENNKKKDTNKDYTKGHVNTKGRNLTEPQP